MLDLVGSRCVCVCDCVWVAYSWMCRRCRQGRKNKLAKCCTWAKMKGSSSLYPAQDKCMHNVIKIQDIVWSHRHTAFRSVCFGFVTNELALNKHSQWTNSRTQGTRTPTQILLSHDQEVLWFEYSHSNLSPVSHDQEVLSFEYSHSNYSNSNRHEAAYIQCTVGIFAFPW